MPTFEVRVLVKKKGSRHFSSHIGKYIEETVTKMFHIDAKTPNNAGVRAEKYGRPISVRKADFERMGGNIEDLLLPEVYGVDNPYPNALAMDGMIWKQKNKRAKRIESSARKKNGY